MFLNFYCIKTHFLFFLTYAIFLCVFLYHLQLNLISGDRNNKGRSLMLLKGDKLNSLRLRTTVF